MSQDARRNVIMENLEKHARVLAFNPARLEEPFVISELRSDTVISRFCFISFFQDHSEVTA